MVFSALFSAFVLTVLWGWFIGPTFHVGQISIPMAIGLSVAIGMFTNRSTSSEKSNEKRHWELLLESFLVALLSPLVALIFGAIAHAFV